MRVSYLRKYELLSIAFQFMLNLQLNCDGTGDAFSEHKLVTLREFVTLERIWGKEEVASHLEKFRAFTKDLF